MNSRLPGSKGKKLAYHLSRCSWRTSCSQTWELLIWQVWLLQMVSPKSGLSSLYCNSSSPWARRAIQCRRTLPAKYKCSQTASEFYLPTASWEHSWTHAKELASGLLQAWMWSLDSKLIKIDEHRWEMIDVWECGDIRNTMDTHWRWWERNTVEKIAHVPFLGTTKFHSLGLPFKSSNSKAESSSSHSRCICSFTQRAMSRRLLKRFCALNALLMGINLLISCQCRKSPACGTESLQFLFCKWGYRDNMS